MTDMPDPQKLAQEVKSALATLQEDSKGTKGLAEDTKRNLEKFMHDYQDYADGVAKKFAAAEKEKAEFEEKVAKAETELAEAKKGSEEYKSRLEKLETLIATKGKTGEDPHLSRQTPEYKNLFAYLKAKGNSDLADIDFKTLRTDNEVSGAYLIPQVLDNEIRKNITEISPVRAFARVRMAPGKTMDIPRRLALLRAYYEGETEQDELGQSTYGSEQVTLYRQSVTVPASLDMMVSSAFDLEREIAADVGESFGQSEGTAFITGTGVKGPQGIVMDSRIDVTETATTAQIDFVDMAEIAGKLKRGQAPWWFMNRRTLAKMWQIKSTIGVPIWQPVAGDQPATIWGFPYNSDMIDLDDAQDGTGAKPIVFGDLRRGYEIFDMVGISVVRDDLTRKREAITEWTFRRYNTGRVILPEAIKILKVK